MAYIEYLDPNGPTATAWDAACVEWDNIDPEWDVKGLHPEYRLTVDYWDVSSDSDYPGLDAVLDWEAAHPEYFQYPLGYGE